jgi:hypothetical protein
MDGSSRIPGRAPHTSPIRWNSSRRFASGWAGAGARVRTSACNDEDAEREVHGERLPRRVEPASASGLTFRETPSTRSATVQQLTSWSILSLASQTVRSARREREQRERHARDQPHALERGDVGAAVDDGEHEPAAEQRTTGFAHCSEHEPGCTRDAVRAQTLRRERRHAALDTP